MRRLTKKESDRYRAILGSTHVEKIQTHSTQGPLGMLALGEQVRRRLQSRGGRPTMPEWDLKRPIPLRHTDWAKLTERGRKLGISPAQCAALLIERGLAALESKDRKRSSGKAAATTSSSVQRPAAAVRKGTPRAAARRVSSR